MSPNRGERARRLHSERHCSVALPLGMRNYLRLIATFFLFRQMAEHTIFGCRNVGASLNTYHFQVHHIYYVRHFVLDDLEETDPTTL